MKQDKSFEEMFDKKVFELENADDFQEDGESGIYEFGYKIKRGNEIFTVPDWGNIKYFISQEILNAKEEENLRVQREIIGLMNNPLGVTTLEEIIKAIRLPLSQDK